MFELLTLCGRFWPALACPPNRRLFPPQNLTHDPPSNPADQAADVGETFAKVAGLPAARHPERGNSDGAREARSTWARLIKKVFAVLVDP